MSVITVAVVTSEPVPQVVGIATMGAMGFLILPMPSMSRMFISGLAITAPAALAVSMELPPPMPRRQSHPSALYRATDSSTQRMLGLGSTPVYST